MWGYNLLHRRAMRDVNADRATWQYGDVRVRACVPGKLCAAADTAFGRLVSLPTAGDAPVRDGIYTHTYG